MLKYSCSNNHLGDYNSISFACSFLSCSLSFFSTALYAISSHFKKKGISLWLPQVLDNSESLLYLTRFHSQPTLCWMGSEGHLFPFLSQPKMYFLPWRLPKSCQDLGLKLLFVKFANANCNTNYLLKKNQLETVKCLFSLPPPTKLGIVQFFLLL